MPSCHEGPRRERLLRARKYQSPIATRAAAAPSPYQPPPTAVTCELGRNFGAPVAPAPARWGCAGRPREMKSSPTKPARSESAIARAPSWERTGRRSSRDSHVVPPRRSRARAPARSRVTLHSAPKAPIESATSTRPAPTRAPPVLVWPVADPFAPASSAIARNNNPAPRAVSRPRRSATTARRCPLRRSVRWLAPSPTHLPLAAHPTDALEPAADATESAAPDRGERSRDGAR